MANTTTTFRFTSEEKDRIEAIGAEIGIPHKVDIMRYLINKEFKLLERRRKESGKDD